jgi:hypothetical protein
LLLAQELFRLSRKNQRFYLRCKITGVFLAAFALFAIGIGAAAARPDEPAVTDKVGAIEGDAISVEGPMSVDVVGGKVRTVLRSGSDVRVKAGQARIDLVEGGHITICGPAHFSVLKSGGALTVALESGTIRAFMQNEPALTVYTPQIQARPISIGNGSMEILVGIDSTGSMCIRATKGAVRIEQQLTGQNMLVPQNGDVTLANGQLETLKTSAGHCLCEEQQILPSSTGPVDVSQLASPEESRKKAAEKKAVAPPASTPAPTDKPEPVYQVFMPPLHYDANSKNQEEFDPNLIILVRRVRVRPTLIFQGKVEGDPIVAQNTVLAAPPPSAAAAKPKPEDTTWSRVKTYFRKLWTPGT